jgi:hypothetical protein
MFDPTTRMPTSERLKQYKLNEDQVIANQQKQIADKAIYDKAVADAKNKKTDPPPVPESLSTSLIYKGKKIPGYDQMAGEILTPEKGYFISNVVNSMLTDQAAVDNALVELESTLPKGQRLATLVMDKMTKNNISEEEAAYAVAAEYIVDKHYPTWANENAKFFQASKASSGGVGPKGNTEKPKPSNIEKSIHLLSNQGYINAKKENLPEDEASMDPRYREGGNYIGEGPGIYFDTKSTEPVRIDVNGRVIPVNPSLLFFNNKNNQYYLKYTTTLSPGVGTTVTQDEVFKVSKLSKSDLATLRASQYFGGQVRELEGYISNAQSGSSGSASGGVDYSKK